MNRDRCSIRRRIYAVVLLLVTAALATLTWQAGRVERAATAAREAGFRVDLTRPAWPGILPQPIRRLLPDRSPDGVRSVVLESQPISTQGLRTLEALPPAEQLSLKNAARGPDVLRRFIERHGSRLRRVDLTGNYVDASVLTALEDHTLCEFLAWDPPDNEQALLRLAAERPADAAPAVAHALVRRFIADAGPDDRRAAHTSAVMPFVMRSFREPHWPGQITLSGNRRPGADRVVLTNQAAALLDALPRVGSLVIDDIEVDWSRAPDVSLQLTTDLPGETLADLLSRPTSPEIIGLFNVRCGDAGVSKLRSEVCGRLDITTHGGRPLLGTFLPLLAQWPALKSVTIGGDAQHPATGTDDPIPAEYVRNRFPEAVADSGLEAVQTALSHPIECDLSELTADDVGLYSLNINGSSLKTLGRPLKSLKLGRLPFVEAADIAAVIRQTRPQRLVLGYSLPWDESVVEAIADVAPEVAKLSPPDDFPPEVFARHGAALTDTRLDFGLSGKRFQDAIDAASPSKSGSQ